MHAPLRTAALGALAAGALAALALPAQTAAADSPVLRGRAAASPTAEQATVIRVAAEPAPTPTSGVRVGVEGVRTPDGAVLIAGGVGMAAVGAAGLGFAMLRRGRTNR
ncbi:hypothetical protein [Streptomyces sp. NPDC093225]|uniref:hypothetical protein n=1 Tax=Streptomyces sp. NPDC093225 TaxID=3366034 RepID=UPI0038241A78